MRELLAYDLGASSGRLIRGAFDGDKLTIEELHRFSNDPVQVNGHMYWDVLRLLHEMKRGLRRARRQGIAAQSLGIDTWGVDYGLLDGRGNLMANPYHYRDARTDRAPERFYADVMTREELYGITGIAMIGFNTLFQLHTHRLDEPEVIDRAQTMLFIPDLLAYFLTGEKSTEYTVASTGQMLDVKTRDWSRPLLEAAGIDSRLLTDICQPGTIKGQLSSALCKELGVKPMPLVAVAEHDTASAVAAMPGQGEDRAYISSGTWSLMGMELRQCHLDAATLNFGYTHEGGLEGNLRFLRNIMGLWIIQEIQREWETAGEEISFARMVELAREAKPFQSFIDPDDARFGKPGDMCAKVQAFCAETGQRVPQGKGEIIRCVYESLAMRYRWTLAGMEEVTGRRVGVLHIIGGGSQNGLLNEMTAAAIGRPVLAGPSEATAIGNLLVQAMALGDIANQGELRQVVARSFPTQEFLPQGSADWDAAYETYLKYQG